MKRPIATINAELGDESFVAAFGRMPTIHDDATVRVATHVGYVARTLRDRDASQLPAPVRARRAELLDELDAYVAIGAFPASETDHGLLPTFVDPTTGVRCAVAHLVEASAGTELMTALDRDHHNAYIADMLADPRFIAWAADSGLTAEELAWIQPSYAYQPPPPTDVRISVAAEVASAPARDDAMPHGFTLAHAGLEWVEAHDQPFYNRLVVAFDGAVGATAGAHAAAFAGHVHVGNEIRFWGDQYSANIAGYAFGAGLDRFGPELPAAWTFPVDGYLHHQLSVKNVVGIHGTIDLAPGGFGLADRTWIGGTAGVVYTRRRVMSRIDATLSVDATRIGDTTFVGLTFGFVTGPRMPMIPFDG